MSVLSEPLIIALETSTYVCSLAISRGSVLVAEVSLHKKNSHAEVVISAIEYLLRSSNLKMNDISAVAISAGPGSYTGLRIGASFAKGLCFTLKIPLISINTLEAMALGAQSFNTHKALVCPMIDARRMEVYTLVMDRNNQTIMSTCAKIIDSESFNDLLDRTEMIFFGDGSTKCYNHLNKNKNAKFLEGVYPNSINIARLAYLNFIDNKFEDLSTFSPIYLKQFGEK